MPELPCNPEPSLHEQPLTPEVAQKLSENRAAIHQEAIETGVQGSTAITTKSEHPKSNKGTNNFKPTTAIKNADGIDIAWDMIEAECREHGVATAAVKFKVSAGAIHSRKKLKRWRGIPDARTLTKRDVQADSELIASGGDLTRVIGGHNARLYEKVSGSIDKFKAKAPKSFKELEVADKLVRRALGVDRDEAVNAPVLIQINEAIGAHESPQPIEAFEVRPCNPSTTEPEQHSLGEPVVQGSTLQEQPPADTTKADNTISEHPARSLTLNVGDSSRRQYVIP